MDKKVERGYAMTIADTKVPPKPEQGKPQPCGKKLYLPDDVYECLLPREHEPPCSPYAASQPLVPQLRKVRLLADVHGDLPFGPPHFAKAGVHDAELNPQGAVSVRDNLGELLGVKPDEFEWVEPLVPQQEPTRTFSEADLKEHAMQLGAIGMCGIDRPLELTRANIIEYMEKHFQPKAGVPSEQGTPPQGAAKDWSQVIRLDKTMTSLEIPRNRSFNLFCCECGLGHEVSITWGDPKITLTMIRLKERMPVKQSTGWVEGWKAGRDAAANRVEKYSSSESELCEVIAKHLWALPTPPSGETT